MLTTVCCDLSFGNMRNYKSSLLTLLIILCVLYIINEYRILKLNKSSSASMKVIDKDNNITILRDNFLDDIHVYESWSEEKINKFLQLKENHYEQRGARVNQYCHLQVT